MALIEIERKYLVRGDFLPSVVSSVRIVQGYLSSAPERTVRVRIKGDKAFLTIKGSGSSDGLERFEWEKEISVSEAESLLPICEKGVIDKVRHLVPAGDGLHTWEIDVFSGENSGLVLAEIELRSRADTFPLPEWLGDEVTGDIHYYNSYLSQHPYKEW